SATDLLRTVGSTASGRQSDSPIASMARWRTARSARCFVSWQLFRNHAHRIVPKVTPKVNSVSRQSSITTAITRSVSMVGFSMARSAILSFDDPISYQTAIRGAAVEVFVTSKRSFLAELLLIQFDKLCMQYGRENLTRVAHSAIRPKRGGIVFLTDANQPAAQYCGMDVSSDAIVITSAGSSRHVRSWDACRWAALTLRVEDLSATG